MSNGKTVLVATDLSARCDRAVDRAVQLADHWRSRLQVLHVVEDKDSAGPTDDAIRDSLPDSGADVEILLRQGSAPETIARVAEKTGSDLIVTGVARYNQVGDYVLGTAVDHVIRHAAVPVLVVKQRPRGDYRTMLVPSDLSPPSRSALLRAAELFPHATVHLVYAYHVPYEAWFNSEEVRQDVQQEAQSNLDAFLATLPAPLRQRVRARLGYGETAQVVAAALEESGADLVVLGTHARSRLGHVTAGSTAEWLLSWVRPDTLVVREQQQ